MVVHLGVSGTRHQHLMPAQTFELGRIIGGLLEEGVVVHHGDCVGIDADVAVIMEHYGIPVVVHPPLSLDLRAFTDTMTNVASVRDVKPYLDRNHDIVDESDLLLAFPRGKEVQRSGTWATIRYARKVGKPVRVIYPDGTREEE